MGSIGMVGREGGREKDKVGGGWEESGRDGEKE